MDQGERSVAADTAVNSLKAVEILYRHLKQVLDHLTGGLRDRLKLRIAYGPWGNSQRGDDPRTWVHQYRRVLLCRHKVSLEDLKRGEHPPFLFVLISLVIRDREPQIRYGVISKIHITGAWKGANVDSYLGQILDSFHHEPREEVEARHCRASLRWQEKPLLDVRSDTDVASLVGTIDQEFGNAVMG